MGERWPNVSLPTLYPEQNLEKDPDVTKNRYQKARKVATKNIIDRADHNRLDIIL